MRSSKGTELVIVSPAELSPTGQLTDSVVKSIRSGTLARPWELIFVVPEELTFGTGPGEDIFVLCFLLRVGFSGLAGVGRGCCR